MNESASIVDSSRTLNWHLLRPIRFLTFGFYNSNNSNCSHCNPMEPITPIDHIHHYSDVGKTTATTCEHLVVATPIDTNNPQPANSNKTSSQLSLSKCSECSRKIASNTGQQQVPTASSDLPANKLLQLKQDDSNIMVQGNQRNLAISSKHQPQQQGSKQQQQQPIHILVEPINDESVRCDCRHCQFFSGWCCMPCVLILIVMVIIVWLVTKWSRESDVDNDVNNSTKATTIMVPNDNLIPAYETIN